MNQKSSLIISVSIHIILLLIFLLFTPETEEVPEEKKINIELVTKKEKKSTSERDVKGENVDIKSGSKDIKTTLEEPQSNNYTQNFIDKVPDLVVQSSPRDLDEPLSDIGFDISEFESSLSDLMPVEEFIEAPESEDITIKWEGDRREIQKNSNIDFSSFPKESFTGVGVHVEFMVNAEGEVFSVNVKPPGSGSVDFDILIRQYVTKFMFNKSEITSKGEIFIVYKK